MRNQDNIVQVGIYMYIENRDLSINQIHEF